MSAAPTRGPLPVGELLREKNFLVIGGTGFLGKVWLSLLLRQYPGVGHIYLMVRERKNQSSEERFWAEIVSSEAFDPLREKYPGPAYEEFMRRHLTPIAGDVSHPYAGVSEAVRDEIRGSISALINAAGVVDFNPPLDDALKVNAFGMQSLVALAKDLGEVPFLHTSTCYVAGNRTGQVDEVHPFDHPFPRSGELDLKHWSAEGEIEECVDLVDNVRHRSQDAFRQSDFLDTARRNLKEKGEPTAGSALRDELSKVVRRYESDRLIDAGVERAKFWGWHNVYTYTKAIGEQVLCRSGLPFAIARPAVIESSISYPRPGWNEGINTSAPLIYMAMQGVMNFPGHTETVLDMIPVDTVASGMILSLAELLEGTHFPVYQYGSSDTNPLPIFRLIELVALYKRRHYKEKSRGNPFLNWVQAHYGPTPIKAKNYYEWGPKRVGETAEAVSKALEVVGREVLALKPIVDPASRMMGGLGKSSKRTAFILDQFVPFMATHNYRFSCANVRSAFSRLSDEDRERLPWAPEAIDWHHYVLEVHCPGIEEIVIPQIEEKLERPKKPLRAYDDLGSFLEQVAERYEHAPALLLTHEDGLAKVSFLEIYERSKACALRLQNHGLESGQCVLLAGANHPDWVVAWFGILLAGGRVVPVDPQLTPPQVANIAATASVVCAVLDSEARERFGEVLEGEIFEPHTLTAPGPTEGLVARVFDGDEVASVLFTSGTTGVPKGVMLTHRNFTSLIAALGNLFGLSEKDRVLSVLPMHHTFEFTCGLLLPLSRGARVLYLDELSGDALTRSLKAGRITGMVGVPALWQLLERRITSQVREKGALFELAFDAGTEFNRMVGRQTGLDVGKVFFGSVHNRLGGNIRFLISGGAALPSDTQVLFQGLGLHLSEGYGLTEAAPVLTVAEAKPGGRTGHVGKPLPGVEIEIREPDEHGVGEVAARGPNVMKGYFENVIATEAVLDEEGWLLTGDLGRLDHKGRLHIVGRAKDVVVTSLGENIYLDDVENQIGQVAYVEEYSLVGIDDPRGGERLGLMAVCESRKDLDAHSVRARAKERLKERLSQLPPASRPSVLHFVDADLPRTATRKVKRNEVRKVLERIAAASKPRGEEALESGPVRSAVAQVAGKAPSEILANTEPAQDLGFDSLMWVELASALEGLGTGRPSAEALSECETVAEIEALVAAPAPIVLREEDSRDTVTIPEPFVAPLRSALRTAQHGAYSRLLDVAVTGRAFIPQNRQTIVVSNHCSHLDMGLVKYALGDYGKKMVALAAKDYFFQGNKWIVAYFEQLTNLQPVDRSGSFRRSLEEALAVVQSGAVVLLFPEGTRRTDGVLGEFKPLVGKLALDSAVDVLPLYLDGTFDVLPKGAAIPRGRDLKVRIGPPLQSGDLLRLTEGMRSADAAREAAGLIRRAVNHLREGGVLDLSTLTRQEPSARKEEPKDEMESLFGELEERFQPEKVERPISWYFSLNGAENGRWTVEVGDEGCTVQKGRPAKGKADCVIKTSPGLLTRIVREAYVPSVPEFMSGKIKTNELPLLQELSKIFHFGEMS